MAYYVTMTDYVTMTHFENNERQFAFLNAGFTIGTDTISYHCYVKVCPIGDAATCSTKNLADTANTCVAPTYYNPAGRRRREGRVVKYNCEIAILWHCDCEKFHKTTEFRVAILKFRVTISGRYFTTLSRLFYNSAKSRTWTNTKIRTRRINIGWSHQGEFHFRWLKKSYRDWKIGMNFYDFQPSKLKPLKDNHNPNSRSRRLSHHCRWRMRRAKGWNTKIIIENGRSCHWIGCFSCRY